MPVFNEERIIMKKLFRIRESRFSLILLALAPVATFYLLEWYTHNPFETMKATPQILNIILFELLALLLFCLFGRLHVALIAETLFFAIYGLVNYFVLSFRSVPIQPWDLFSIGTAASVADNYSYTLDAQAVLALLGFLLLLILEFFCRYTLKRGTRKAQWRFRLPSAAVLCVLLAAFGLMFHSDEIVEQKLRLYNKLFTPTTISYKNGTALAFLMELRYLSVEKPEGYDPGEAADSLLLLEDARGQEAEETPNIIVIMDEAFSDPAVLGAFTANQDYMPFVHSLMDGAENTVSGWLNVSVVGGNTANTEFEYLTGHTMAFLPQGSVPYQQYVTGTTPSMASHLASLGYRTAAMHPYKASGWDRDTVYPSFGFSESYFLPDFENPALVRNYVSDQADFEKIIRLLDDPDRGEPLFLFNVTMQNHSSYTESFDNFHPAISVDQGSTSLDNYLSLIRLTDDALKNLVSWLEDFDENTILVFFGDHQPTDSVVTPIYRQNGRSISSLSDEELSCRYKVPFLIWANYDIEEESGVETSVNYLGARTLQAAGLPLSGYWNYLTQLSARVPVITANHVLLSDGTFTTADEAKELLSDYRKYQYYQLFDFAER